MEFQKEESEEDDDETEENEITREELSRRVLLALMCGKGALRWLGILCLVGYVHPMLRSLTISDSMDKGVRLCLVGEELVECKNTLDMDRIVSLAKDKYWTQENMRVGYVPVLELPVSGYVMEGVTIINLRLYGDADDSEADSAMLDVFAEEQGVFLEAVVQILENHRDGIKTYV